MSDVLSAAGLDVTGLDVTDLDITGMTCASCANRIERKLNKLDGVHASVNYATEQAHVQHSSSIDVGDLIDAVSAAGYSAALPTPEHAPDEPVGQGRRLLVTAVASVMVAAVSMIPPLHFPGWQYAALVLTSGVVFWGGFSFHRAAVVNARHGASTMDTLVSIGTLAAYFWSVWAVFAGGHLYFEVAVAVTTFLLAGRYAEARAKRSSGAALRALLEVGAKDVAVRRGTTFERVPLAQLMVGDVFETRPGEKIASDGTVLTGSSAVDKSTVTGESVPVDVAEGDDVVGGTVNVTGLLTVRADKVGSDTQLARIAKLVTDAQNGKAEAQRLADRVSGVFVPVVLVIAVVTFAAWLVFGGALTAAFTAAIAVLIVACPCALGLATPTALLVGTGRGAQMGILIRGPEVLEQTRRIDTVVLDKTGTITSGRMSVVSVDVAHGEDADVVLRMAAAVEAGSEHPVARAVVDRAPDHPEATEFTNKAGHGVTGVVNGTSVSVGKPSADVPPELAEAFAAPYTVVAVEWDDAVRGLISVADTIKDSSAEAIAQMRSLGLTPVLLTGDSAVVAHQVAAQVGIDRVISGVTPTGKASAIAHLQQDGHAVVMVGDGVNDAAALATADVGMAMGTGTDAAIEAADVTLLRGDLGSVPQAIRLARATLGTIKANLFWAFVYNAAAIPLAALGLLDPMIAGAAMALSSVFVVTNSLRLRTFS